jgi:hypothetical protein
MMSEIWISWPAWVITTASAAIHRASARKFEIDLFTELYPSSPRVAAPLFFNHVILA